MCVFIAYKKVIALFKCLFNKAKFIDKSISNSLCILLDILSGMKTQPGVQRFGTKMAFVYMWKFIKLISYSINLNDSLA